jgi:hypothetical protein
MCYQLICILVVAIILYTLWLYKNRSGFQDADAELLKQIKAIEYMKQHDPRNQVKAYIPHFDILNKYESSANSLLIPLKSNIDESIIKRNNTLNDMEKTVDEMSTYAAKKLIKKYQDKNYETLKSHNNGAELSLNRLGETGKYMVNMNGPNTCLSVPENNDYEVVPCNAEDKTQHFNLDFVYNMNQYRNRLDPGYPKLDVIGKTKFPFVFLRSNTNNNCVKNVHGQISVEPCREYTGQRWAPIEKKVTC